MHSYECAEEMEKEKEGYCLFWCMSPEAATLLTNAGDRDTAQPAAGGVAGWRLRQQIPCGCATAPLLDGKSPMAIPTLKVWTCLRLLLRFDRIRESSLPLVKILLRSPRVASAMCLRLRTRHLQPIVSIGARWRLSLRMSA